jgi:hypothetical protein
VAELLRREQRQLPDAFAEPDVAFIVVPVEAEAHFVRDYDGQVRPAAEVERRRAWMRRDFGVDVLEAGLRRVELSGGVDVGPACRVATRRANRQRTDLAQMALSRGMIDPGDTSSIAWMITGLSSHAPWLRHRPVQLLDQAAARPFPPLGRVALSP